MRMNAGVAGLLFASLVLSGCAGADGGEPVATSSAPLPALGTTPIVHGVDGRVLPASAYPGELPVFAQRYVADQPGGEPTIAVDRSGVAIYPTISFDVAGGAAPSTKVYASDDEGKTWRYANPTLGNSGIINAAPTTLDPYVYADPVTGRLYNVELNLAWGSFISWSDDGARTWTANPLCCGVPVDDHQSFASGPATFLPTAPLAEGRILYYCVNQIADSMCTHSVDGGLTWSVGQPAFGASPPGEGAASECVGLTGHVHASEATGTVFLGAGCSQAEIARSVDNGVTWTHRIVDASVGIDGHEASVATDAAGNVYYFFLDDNQLPRLSISTDDGITWSAPLNVTAPGVTTAKFPTVVAGEAGKVAFHYVGSTTPSGSDVYDDGNEQELENATWHGYVGMSLDVLAADPVFASVRINDPADPLARGNCSGRCYREEGGMYDFFDIDTNPLTGQVWVALVDMCNDDSARDDQPSCSSPEGTFDSYHRSMGAVGVQVGGTLLGPRV